MFAAENNRYALTSTSSYCTDRGTGKCKSLVQTLLHRQLGFQFASEVVLTRQIFNSRTASAETVGKSVKPLKIGLKQQCQVQEKKGKKTFGRETMWKQISSVASQLPDFGITDNRIWIRGFSWGRNTIPNGERDIIAREEFYSVEPSAFSQGFKRLTTCSYSAPGIIKKSLLLTGGRNLHSGEESSTFLITLQTGHLTLDKLRAFDLIKNEFTNELVLDHLAPNVDTWFEDIDSFDGSRKIVVVGYDEDGHANMLITLEYPPWKKVGIIHVDTIKYEVVFMDGVIFLVKGKDLMLTTWNLLMKSVKRFKKGEKTKTIKGMPYIKFEGRLSEVPIILSKFEKNGKTNGLLNNCSVPLYFVPTTTGMKFLTFHEKPKLVYEYESEGGEGGDAVQVFPFPDGSAKALIITHFSGESELIEFVSEWNDELGEKEVKVRKIGGLDFWEKSRQMSRSSANGDGRPKRVCLRENTDKILAGGKKAILGMAYCEKMDLISVLTADDEDFQVGIYEPLNFKMVKALPVACVWPRMKGSDDVNRRRECIDNVDFAFESEFIFIKFLYSSGCNPQREVFFARLLSEQH